MSNLLKSLVSAALVNTPDQRDSIPVQFEAFDVGEIVTPEPEKSGDNSGPLKGRAYMAMYPNPPHPMTPEMAALLKRFEDVNEMLYEARRALWRAQEDAWQAQEALGEEMQPLKTQYSRFPKPEPGTNPKMPDAIIDSPNRASGDDILINLGDVALEVKKGDILFPVYIMAGGWGFDPVTRRPHPLYRFPQGKDAQEFVKGHGIATPYQNEKEVSDPPRLTLSYGVNVSEVDAWKAAGAPQASDPFIVMAKSIDSSFDGDHYKARRVIEAHRLQQWVDAVNAPLREARELMRWIRENVGAMSDAKWPSSRVFGKDSAGEPPAAVAKPAAKPAVPDDI